ncbi:ACT domain-containing protein [Anaerococcus sp. AGMB09787]|uniref:ACT domain-containing protein n=1 Tax=Anaerococcus sp. AGMB09787 TaxID=2922869 RepID=UPI001FAF16E5|nr:ACT domain-containing protein [Anaerococcus sp. AGMB09787]
MKAILTVVGIDRPGIIYRVSEALYKFNINILDFSQTIMEDKFVAIINIDLAKASDDFTNISDYFTKLGEENGLSIRLQNEKLFDKMHRI